VIPINDSRKLFAGNAAWRCVAPLAEPVPGMRLIDAASARKTHDEFRF
jgi:hypothetical protein